MKSILKTLTPIVLLISLCSYSQEPVDLDYLKKNIVFTNLKILGINKTHYAKSVQCINFDDPRKLIKLVTISGSEFADDGQDYDLTANDGILTSKKVFPYSINQTSVTPGTYVDVKENKLVHDEDFIHAEQAEAGERIGIRCRFIWVPCHAMPEPRRSMCLSLGWPYGNLDLAYCELDFSIF